MDVDTEVVYTVCQMHLGELRQTLERLIADLAGS